MFYFLGLVFLDIMHYVLDGVYWHYVYHGFKVRIILYGTPFPQTLFQEKPYIL